MQQEWRGKWISLRKEDMVPSNPAIDGNGDALPIAFEEIILDKVYQTRKDICIKKKIKKATLLVTAHGVYRLFIDGRKVGKYELSPEHTQYQNQLLYQNYDVTDLLWQGNHALAAIVAPGWYSGRIGFAGDNCQYGTDLSILIQLEIEYQNGDKEVIGSDESFDVMESAYVYSDLFVGEKYDARLETKKFFQYGFRSAALYSAIIRDYGYDNLIPHYGGYIEKLEEIAPRTWFENDGIIIDFGDTVSGRVRVELNEKKNTVVKIEHSEILGTNGQFINNIREAFRNQIDLYICNGGEEIYEPAFTYHGFRYVKITGTTNLKPEKVRAVVIGTNLEQTISFHCSDERLNQLHRNIIRSQKSNMISIPTDCPQREKAGWTGDVQVYGETSCYNMYMRDFYKRWLSDVRFNQTARGQIPIIVPFLPGYNRTFEGIDCSAGWSDVIINLPWNLYQVYDDKEALIDNYDAMKRWISYIEVTAQNENPEELVITSKEQEEHLHYIWNTGFHFGDWLTPSVSINLETGAVDMMQSAFLTMDIVPTLFYYKDACTMEKIALVLNKKEDAEKYHFLAKKVKKAFNFIYVSEDKKLKSELQGIHVLALAFGILEEQAHQNAITRLIQLIHENGDKMDVGFLSVPYILEVLCEVGYKEIAYKLLFNEECPSWLYEIKKGATSIWESWQAILPDDSPAYLSMNHYASGSVAVWMYHHILGIKKIPETNEIVFQPDTDNALNYAMGSYKTKLGTVKCRWEKEKDIFKINISVPEQMTGRIMLGDEIISVQSGNYEYVLYMNGRK